MKVRGRLIHPITLAFTLVLALSCFGFAQSSEKTAPTAEQSAPDATAHQVPGQEAGQHPLAEGAKEEPEEENAQFLKSPSVKWLAKTLGMTPGAASVLFFVINFAILAGALGWLMKSRLPGWSRSRNESITRSLEEARHMSQEARERLSAIEARLSRIDTEISEMRASAEKEARIEEQRILAAAEEDKQRIVAAAEQEIGAAVRLARRDLKAYAASLAVDLAERRIQVDASTDRVLVGRFAQRFGKDGA